MPKHNQYILNNNLSVDTITTGITNQKILVIDNVLKTPEALVEFACNHPFVPYPTMQFNKGYPGIRLLAPADYSQSLMETIKPILTSEFDYPKDAELGKTECSISLMTVKPEDLALTQLTPHIDTNNFHQFAILLYLCNESHGGTAFYRHNATRLETITQDTSEAFIKHYFDEINHKRPKQEYFSESNEYFTKTGMVSVRFNRMVIYRSCLLHSSYIRPERSIDTNPRTGRLTVNSFVAF